MNSQAATGLGVSAAVVAGVLVGAAIAACATSREATIYGAQLTACVETARTKAESQACRCDVNRRWNRPCTPDVDGGTDGAQ